MSFSPPADGHRRLHGQRVLAAFSMEESNSTITSGLHKTFPDLPPQSLNCFVGRDISGELGIKLGAQSLRQGLPRWCNSGFNTWYFTSISFIASRAISLRLCHHQGYHVPHKSARTRPSVMVPWRGEAVGDEKYSGPHPSRSPPRRRRDRLCFLRVGSPPAWRRDGGFSNLAVLHSGLLEISPYMHRLSVTICGPNRRFVSFPTYFSSLTLLLPLLSVLDPHRP